MWIWVVAIIALTVIVLFRPNREGIGLGSARVEVSQVRAQVTTQEGNWTKKTNTAIPNPDGKTVVGTFQNLPDAECKTKCLDNTNCKGFTNYTHDAGGSSCLLMSSTDGDFNYKIAGGSATSFKYDKAAADKASYDWALQADTYYPMDTYLKGDAATLNECIASCDTSTDQCLAIGYIPDASNGNCLQYMTLNSDPITNVGVNFYKNPKSVPLNTSVNPTPMPSATSMDSNTAASASTPYYSVYIPNLTPAL